MEIFLIVTLSIFSLCAVALAARLYGENKMLQTMVADSYMREIGTRSESKENLERLFEKVGVPAPYRERPMVEGKSNRRFVPPSLVVNDLRKQNAGLVDTPSSTNQKVPEAVKREFLNETKAVA